MMMMKILRVEARTMQTFEFSIQCDSQKPFVTFLLWIIIIIWANPGLFCLFFTVKLFTTMIYRLGIQ